MRFSGRRIRFGQFLLVLLCFSQAGCVWTSYWTRTSPITSVSEISQLSSYRVLVRHHAPGLVVRPHLREVLLSGMFARVYFASDYCRKPKDAGARIRDVRTPLAEVCANLPEYDLEITIPGFAGDAGRKEMPRGSCLIVALTPAGKCFKSLAVAYATYVALEIFTLGILPTFDSSSIGSSYELEVNTRAMPARKRTYSGRYRIERAYFRSTLMLVLLPLWWLNPWLDVSTSEPGLEGWNNVEHKKVWAQLNRKEFYMKAEKRALLNALKKIRPGSL